MFIFQAQANEVVYSQMACFSYQSHFIVYVQNRIMHPMDKHHSFGFIKTSST